MPVEITWLGHAALALNIDGARVLVDPFLSGNPLAAADPNTIEADYIIVTHGHGDHVGDTVAIAKRTGATVISNAEISSWLRRQGVARTHGQNPDGAFDHGFAKVALTPALHSSGLPDGSYGGDANGVLITTREGHKLYLAGDTGLFPGMSLIGDLGLSFAALPIGGNYTMGPDEALRAVEMLRPTVVLPIHYNTFEVIQCDVVAWAERVHTQTASKVIVLDPGGVYTL